MRRELYASKSGKCFMLVGWGEEDVWNDIVDDDVVRTMQYRDSNSQVVDEAYLITFILVSLIT